MPLGGAAERRDRLDGRGCPDPPQPPELRTFSIGFSESSFDETPWSRLAAAELRTQHHEEVARCDSPDLLLHVARHQDEPFADTSILPTHVLCRMGGRT